MKKIMLFMVCFLLLGAQIAFAQSSIKGRVLDDKGNGIDGASVKVKGTNNGTNTDNNGGFVLKNAEGQTLEVAAVGFQKVSVSAENGITVKMVIDRKSVDVVVVTALGMKRSKAELGFATQKLAGAEVTATRSNNALNNLSGKVSGIEIKQNNQMGGSTNIVVRGFKSLTGNNQALIVIDGVPFDNSNTNSSDQTTARGGYDYGNAAADINPDDIASVNVLKGAAATALYGARGSNGVILIETKKARKGVSVEVNTGFNTGRYDKKTFPVYQKEYGAGYGPYYGDTLGGWLDNSFDWNNDGIQDLTVPTTEDASYGGKFDPNLQVYDWRSVDPTSPQYGKTTPWVAAEHDPSYFLQRTFGTSNSFNVSAGNDKSGIKFTYSRNDDKGMLKNSNMYKNFVSVGATHAASEKVSFGLNTTATIMGAKGRYGTGYDSKNPMGSFRQWFQTNVDMKDLEDAYLRNPERNTTWNWGDPSDVSSGPIYWDNPYWLRSKAWERDSRTRLFGSLYSNIKLASWVSLMARVSMDTYHEQQEEFYDIGGQDQSSFSRFNRNYTEMNYDFIANYNKTISSDWKLTGLVGTNVRNTKVQSVYGITSGGLGIANFPSFSNSLGLMTAPSEGYGNTQVNGLFGQATLGYSEYLFMDFTARVDASSTLPVGKNVYFYPSASLTYIFTKGLKSLENSKWLSYGKVRLNYAGVGNSAPYAVAGRDPLNALTSFNGNAVYSSNATKYNNQLVPERTNSSEIGLELAFLKNRITYDVTYYNANSINQILPLAISYAAGYTNQYINAGTINNKGIEMQLGLKAVAKPKFSWNVDFNFTRNRNKVTKLADGIENIQLASMQGGVSLNASLGQPYGVLKGQAYELAADGQRLVDADGYWIKSATSDKVIGNVNPDFLAGVKNTFKFNKNLTFGFLIDMKKGGSVFSLDQFYAAQTGIYATSVGNNDKGNPIRNFVADGGGILLPGVHEDGTPNTTYVEANDYTFGDAKAPLDFVYDASFVKLREVTLGYSMPSKWFKKGIKGADLSVYGRNLWLISKNLPYADPEDGMSSGNVQGYQSGSYPTIKAIGVNLKLNF